MKKHPYVYKGETRILDDAVRSEALGSFAQLADGITQYELAGPEEAQTVVLIHGFSAPLAIWDPTFAALKDAGFRVLRYNLYGRGCSDRPDVPYDADLYDRQLLNLLDVLEIGKPVDLVGLSMGGAVSVAFTDRHPERVRRLVLSDPAGLPMKKLELARWLATHTSLADGLMDLLAVNRFTVTAARFLATMHGYAELEQDFLNQVQLQGYKNALLATLRSGMLTGAEASYRNVGERGVPSMLIWGRQDHTVPFRMNKKVRELMPDVEFLTVDGARHTPLYEKPQVATPPLVEFLRRE